LWDGEIKRLERVLAVMGQVAAWAQLRSSGRQGSATADELIEYGRSLEGKRSQMLEHARRFAADTEKSYQEYVKAYDDRAFADKH
jgi:hypothetical protein